MRGTLSGVSGTGNILEDCFDAYDAIRGLIIYLECMRSLRPESTILELHGMSKIYLVIER